MSEVYLGDKLSLPELAIDQNDIAVFIKLGAA